VIKLWRLVSSENFVCEKKEIIYNTFTNCNSALHAIIDGLYQRYGSWADITRSEKMHYSCPHDTFMLKTRRDYCTWPGPVVSLDKCHQVPDANHLSWSSDTLPRVVPWTNSLLCDRLFLVPVLGCEIHVCCQPRSQDAFLIKAVEHGNIRLFSTRSINYFTYYLLNCYIPTYSRSVKSGSLSGVL